MKCAAATCTRNSGGARPFCSRHWRMLTMVEQLRFWAARPSQQTALEEAMAAVAKYEATHKRGNRR